MCKVKKKMRSDLMSNLDMSSCHLAFALILMDKNEKGWRWMDVNSRKDSCVQPSCMLEDELTRLPDTSHCTSCTSCILKKIQMHVFFLNIIIHSSPPKSGLSRISYPFISLSTVSFTTGILLGSLLRESIVYLNMLQIHQQTQTKAILRITIRKKT